MSSNLLLKQMSDGANQTHLQTLGRTIDFVMFEIRVMFGEETQTNFCTVLEVYEVFHGRVRLSGEAPPSC